MIASIRRYGKKSQRSTDEFYFLKFMGIGCECQSNKFVPNKALKTSSYSRRTSRLRTI